MTRADTHARFLAIRDRALAKHQAHLDALRRTARRTYRDWANREKPVGTIALPGGRD